MLNIPVRAAAEGMPEITRRRLLLGLAAASTAAATAATTAAPSAPAENPELLRLASGLPAIAAAAREANGEYSRCLKEWQERTPWAPHELTVPGTGWPHEVEGQPGKAELKILGGFLWREGDEFPRRIVLTAWDIRGQLYAAHRAMRKAKKAGALSDFMAAEADAQRLKSVLDAAVSYERRFDELSERARNWHDRTYSNVDALKEALEIHVAAIMREPDHTVEGLLIKAQALAEWNSVGTGHFDRVAFKHGQDWHGQIAASILRHAGGVA